MLAYDEVPYVPWGQFVVPGAFRKNVQGVLQFGATLLWNISVLVGGPEMAPHTPHAPRPGGAGGASRT